MAKQKEDRKTLELECLKKPVGRPKGEKPALTAAEKQRAYRARKAQEGLKSLELTMYEVKEALTAVRLQLTRKPESKELNSVERKLTKLG